LHCPTNGSQVADCAALFSLDRSDIIPVDTHVWRIACRDLDPALTDAKSLTPAVRRCSQQTRPLRAHEPNQLRSKCAANAQQMRSKCAANAQQVRCTT